jgi:glycosyltransferase involved in cell wall biosynthesis
LHGANNKPLSRMTQLPLISIIIPCFNGERFVGEAIQSALNQTYPNKEVIVVDDGSTDGSIGVLKSYGDAIFWETGPNRGACTARNRGIEIARGELIQFLDADDLLDSNKLEIQAPLSRDNSDTLVFCDARTDGAFHAHHVRVQSTEDSLVFMLRGGLQTSAAIHQRWWLEQVNGFRLDLPCAQERDLQLRIAAIGVKFRRLPEALYTVRRLEGSISANSKRVLDQHSKILWPIYEDLHLRGELTEDRKREFAGLLARDARAYLRLRHRSEAKAYFDDALRMHPGGGLEHAYGGLSLVLRKAIGAELVESLISLWRRK